MTTRSFDYIVDPGHGWLKVSKQLLRDLGIADAITTYSYQRGDYAYLEEDCDMVALYTALRAKGVEPMLRHRYANQRSRIRGYDSYQGQPS